MIAFRIRGNEWYLKNLWTDLVVSDWIALASENAEVADMQRLRDAYDIPEDLHPLVLRLLGHLTNCTDLHALDIEGTGQLWEMVRTKVLGLWFWEIIDYVPLPKRDYYWKGKKYTLPGGVEIAGKWIPGMEWDARSFVEGAEAVKAIRDTPEGIGLLPLLCAIYLREEEVGFVQAEVIKRSHHFHALPLPIALDCFFFIREYMETYLILSRLSLEDKVRVKVVGWIGFGWLLMRELWALQMLWVENLYLRLLNGLNGNRKKI